MGGHHSTRRKRNKRRHVVHTPQDEEGEDFDATSRPRATGTGLADGGGDVG